MSVSSMTRCLAALGVILATTGVAFGQQPLKVSIGLSSTSIAASAPRIAAEMKLYEKHGLEAKVTPMDTASVATSALIGGSIDFACVNPTDAVLAKVQGKDLVVLRSLYTGFPAVMVLAKSIAEKTGISANAPIPQRLKALDGLVIATLSATSSYTVSLKAAAQAEGAQVRFAYMSQPAMVSALQTGAIQGFVASAPFYGVPVLNGTGLVWISGPQNEYPSKYSLSNSITVVSTRSFVSANPDVVKRLDAVFADLAQAVLERPADVRAAIAKLYPDVDAKSLDLVLQAELTSFAGKESTADDIVRTIGFIKLTGAAIPDDLKPDSLLLKR
jgi:ABC-type nitrate/sulfonate/bicarbonate transport system substrate-binding protein